MSEKRDLWVPAVLALGGLGLLAWNASEGRVLVGVLALLVGLAGGLACLPLRLKRGQARVVGFGAGVALLLLPMAPGIASRLATVLPWPIAAGAFLVPLTALRQEVRVGLLAGVAPLAAVGLLGAAGVLPADLTWIGLAGAFHLAAQVWSTRPRREPAPPPGPRVGVFGGSFDPFHRGHRILVEAALKVLDRLLVVPAGRPPHKEEEEGLTPFHHRLAMTRLGVEGLARTEVLELEGRRPGPSYTVDTLDVVRSSFPEGTRFYLVVGADTYQELPTWHEWERILEQVALLVAGRPGWDREPPPEMENRNAVVQTLEAPLLDVSGTALREALAGGRSVGDLVSPSVLAYVRAHGLYGVAT